PRHSEYLRHERSERGEEQAVVFEYRSVPAAAGIEAQTLLRSRHPVEGRVPQGPKRPRLLEQRPSLRRLLRRAERIRKPIEHRPDTAREVGDGLVRRT